MLLGPPGSGKTHPAIGLGITAARHGHRVLFATATDWVTHLAEAYRCGLLAGELARLRRYGLIIVDKAGYLPFEPGRGTVFGDQAVAAAMIDRIVHHADVLTLKGTRYRFRNLGIDTLPFVKAEDQTHW